MWYGVVCSDGVWYGVLCCGTAHRTTADSKHLKHFKHLLKTQNLKATTNIDTQPREIVHFASHTLRYAKC